jgi:hypothetical protein
MSETCLVCGQSRFVSLPDLPDAREESAYCWLHSPEPPTGRRDPLVDMYKIVRFYRDDTPAEVKATGLTLEQAQAHCRRDDTHGDGWFDGYEKEVL